MGAVAEWSKAFLSREKIISEQKGPRFASSLRNIKKENDKQHVPYIVYFLVSNTSYCWLLSGDSSIVNKSTNTTITGLPLSRGNLIQSIYENEQFVPFRVDIKCFILSASLLGFDKSHSFGVETCLSSNPNWSTRWTWKCVNNNLKLCHLVGSEIEIVPNKNFLTEKAWINFKQKKKLF